MRNFLNISMVFTSILMLIFIFALTSKAGIVGPKPIPSKDHAKELVAEDLRDAANGLFNYMKASLVKQHGKIWANKDGLTPQEVFTALGSAQCDARDQFVLMSTFLNSVVSHSVPAELRPISEQGSGDSCVITVGE